jgi:hypothetical protein
VFRFIKSKIPTQLKRAVRQVALDPAKRVIDDWTIRRSITKLRASIVPDRKLIETLHHAWGNESFSADVTYINEIVARVVNCRAPILESGSGLTTIVAGVLAEKHGLTVWSLEQDREWTEHVAQALVKNGIRNVELRYAPLREYAGYVWYDIEVLDLPKHFDLVLCDGPAVFEHWGPSHDQWRYGVLPVLASKGIQVGEILLDDATEPRAANLLNRWFKEFGFKHQLIHTSDGDYALISRERRP